MRYVIQKWLAHLSRAVVARYAPPVVGITGSVGKTSARNTIAQALAGTFEVRTNVENYNNEFGIPFTIFGVKSPGRSVFRWAAVLWKGVWMAYGPRSDYPNMLVLEFGIDHPGDMAKLCDIAPPTVGVFTAVSPVHLAFFSSIEQIAQEKAVLLSRLPSRGLAVLNADDGMVMAQKDASSAPVRRYAVHAPADVVAEQIVMQTREDFSFEPNETFSTLQFTVHSEQEEVPFERTNGLGNGPISATLAACAVAAYFKVPLETVAQRLRDLPVMPGRLRPLPGIKGSLLLDDSYNAAPASMREGLSVLAFFSPAEGSRRIAVLGKMAELGEREELEHRALGELVVKSDVDLLVTVMGPAKTIGEAAVECGMDPSNVRHFADAADAGRWLDAEVKKGDIVLVKGSQSARMEKVTKDLMAEPLRARELLVRQYGKWLQD